jgi:hypothetical protein
MTRVQNVRRAAPPAEAGTAQPKLVTDAQGILYVEDELGRKIGIRKLKRSERFKLNEATNPTNMSTGIEALIAASVVSVDEEGFPPITKYDQLLARLDELGDEVFAAVSQPVMKLYGLQADPEQDAKDKTTAKNS